MHQELDGGLWWSLKEEVRERQSQARALGKWPGSDAWEAERGPPTCSEGTPRVPGRVSGSLRIPETRTNVVCMCAFLLRLSTTFQRFSNVVAPLSPGRPLGNSPNRGYHSIHLNILKL